MVGEEVRAEKEEMGEDSGSWRGGIKWMFYNKVFNLFIQLGTIYFVMFSCFVDHFVSLVVSWLALPRLGLVYPRQPQSHVHSFAALTCFLG